MKGATPKQTPKTRKSAQQMLSKNSEIVVAKMAAPIPGTAAKGFNGASVYRPFDSVPDVADLVVASFESPDEFGNRNSIKASQKLGPSRQRYMARHKVGFYTQWPGLRALNAAERSLRRAASAHSPSAWARINMLDKFDLSDENSAMSPIPPPEVNCVKQRRFQGWPSAKEA